MSDSTRRPVWLLDVDGVINAYSPQWGEKPREDVAEANGVRYRLRWAPSLIAEIKSLIAVKLVDVVWCTTWCDYADALEKLWEIDPPLARAFGGVPNHWAEMKLAKFDVVTTALAGDRPVIWTDDIEPGEYVELFGRSERTDALFIQPAGSTGLLPRHMREIRAFCEKARDAS